MKSRNSFVLTIGMFLFITTNVFGWARTDSRPFWSTQYRFKVWGGIVYKPYPNGSWSTVKYGEHEVNKGEARVNLNYSKTYPQYYPYYGQQHSISQDARRSRNSTNYTWIANVGRDRAYKKPVADSLEEVHVSFQDSIRNDTFFLHNLTGYFRAKYTGDNVARYKITVWVSNYEGDTILDAYKILWQSGIEFSENGGYVLLNNMPTSGYITGSTALFDVVEFNNLSSYFVLPSGVNQDNIVVSAIAEFDTGEELLPNGIDGISMENSNLRILVCQSEVIVFNESDDLYLVIHFAFDGKILDSRMLKAKNEIRINSSTRNIPISMLAILNKNGEMVRAEKIVVNR